MKTFACLLLIFLSCGCHRAHLRSASRAEVEKVSGTVYFDFDRWRFREDQKETMADTARILNQHRDVSVVLEGHTDPVGPKEYNLELGDRRARMVKGELVEEGVDPGRLVVISFGKTRLKEEGRTPEADRLNRRVELHVK